MCRAHASAARRLCILRAYLVVTCVLVVVKIVGAGSASGFRKEKIVTFAGPQCVSAPDRPAIMPARSHVLNTMLPESSSEWTWRALSLTTLTRPTMSLIRRAGLFTLRADLVLAVALVVAGILQAGVGLPVPLVVR